MGDRELVIQYLTQMKRDLAAKRDKLVRPLMELDKKLAEVSSVLGMALSGPASEDPESVPGFPLKKLKGLTHVKALLEIAKYNGGTLSAQEAKDIMIRAGVLRQTKNSTHMVHGAIARSEAFERIGRGQYRLKGGPVRAISSHTPHVEDAGGSASAGTMQQWPRKTM
jgi:hypothetical protein